MLTFFTTAKPFRGPSGIIQHNALKSWKLLHPDVEVILFGDEEGAADVCAEYGMRHEPHVKRHESGLKYLDYMFARAQKIARHEYLCYSNCDIVLFKDFRMAFETATAWRKRFLLVARRWDTDVMAPIDFMGDDWAKTLRRFALTNGFQQSPDLIDFFLFSRGLYDDVPPLVVGRSAWDAWLVWKALAERAPVIDCSPFIVPVHQNHDHGYHPLGKKGTNEDALAMRNRELSGRGRHLCTIPDSTHQLTKNGRIRWTPFRRKRENLIASPSVRMFREHVQDVVVKTFWIRSRLGLRRQTLHRLLGSKTEERD
jgi:hypothetical protein